MLINNIYIFVLPVIEWRKSIQQKGAHVVMRHVDGRLAICYFGHILLCENVAYSDVPRQVNVVHIESEIAVCS